MVVVVVCVGVGVGVGVGDRASKRHMGRGDPSRGWWMDRYMGRIDGEAGRSDDHTPTYTDTLTLLPAVDRGGAES
jgi:hypothetical protein